MFNTGPGGLPIGSVDVSAATGEMWAVGEAAGPAAGSNWQPVKQQTTNIK
jgi:hypothetical protein